LFPIIYCFIYLSIYILSALYVVRGTFLIYCTTISGI
jgi:hypothetical protein